MSRRAVGGVLATGLLLGLVGLVPVVAQAATQPAANTEVTNAAAAPLAPASPPVDAQPLLLLLVAGGLGTMAFLSREPSAGEPATLR